MSTNCITEIDRKDIQPNQWNRKHFDPVALQELADTITAQGIVQPLIVRELPPVTGVKMKFPRYELVAGERRWRAAAIAKLDGLPCIIKKLDDRQVRELCAVENLQREDLSKLDEAKAYRELLDECQCKVEDLESRLGRKRSVIFARLRLLKLPKAVQAALAEGTIEFSVADLIATIPDPKQQEAALKEILRGEEHWQDLPEGGDKRVLLPLSYRKARLLVEAKFRRPLKDAQFDQKQKFDGLPTCADCPKRTGNIEGLGPGSSPHICTDPACFARKTDLHTTALLAKHKAAGAAVLPASEARGEFSKYGGLTYSSGYQEADEQHWHKGKNVPVTKLLGKDMPAPVYAVDPKGQVQKLYKKSEVKAALIKAKIEQPPPREKPVSKEDKAKAARAEKIEALTLDRLVAAVLKPIEAGKGFEGVFRFLIDQFDNGDLLNHELICRRRKWDNIIEPAKKLDAGGLLALLAEGLLAETWSDEWYERSIFDLAKHTGVKLDKKAIGKQVRAELEAEEKKALSALPVAKIITAPAPKPGKAKGKVKK